MIWSLTLCPVVSMSVWIHTLSVIIIIIVNEFHRDAILANLQGRSVY